MKILAIDLGKTFGWCYLNRLDTQFGEDKYSDIVDWGKKITELLDVWKPDILVVSQTNNFGHWNASRCMLQQAGVAFYICGKKGIPGIEFNDSSARKNVYGKALKKIEVQARNPGMKPNELDAYILAKGFAIHSENKIE